MGDLIIIALLIGFGFIVAEIAKSKGYVRKSGEPKEKGSKKQMYITWWFCGAALFIVSIIYVLVLPKLDTTSSTQKNTADSEMTSQLKKYKSLYESGTITKEEYEKKRKQLLDL